MRIKMLLTGIPPRGNRTRVLAETDLEAHGGAATRVYDEAIERFAWSWHIAPPVMLGYVMVHEIGHVLLGQQHAQSGIMRSRWTAGELARMPSRHLRFEGHESVAIQAAARQTEDALKQVAIAGRK